MSSSFLGRISIARLVAALILVKGLLFLLLIPPWQGPDEAARLEPAVIIARSGSFLPAMEPQLRYQEEAIASMRLFHAWDYYERQAPDSKVSKFEMANLPGGPSYLYESALAYVVPGLTIRWMGIGTVLGELYAGRLASLFLHLLTAGLVGWMAGRIFRGTPAVSPGIAAGLTYAMHPQLSFITASVHPDNLGFLLSALVIALLLVVVARKDARVVSLEWIGPLVLALVLAGLAGYIIRKMLVLSFFAVTVIPVLFGTRWRGFRSIEGMARIALGCMAVGFAFCVVLYEYPELVGWRLLGFPQLAGVDDLAAVGFSRWLRYLGILFATFWLALGSLVNKLSLGWLLVLSGAVGFALYGWYARLMKRSRDLAGSIDISTRGMAILAWWLLWVVVAMLIAYGPNVINPEGRYLLGALPSISLLWVAGWSASNSPQGRLALTTWVILTLFLNAVVLFEYVVPLYYLHRA